MPAGTKVGYTQGFAVPFVLVIPIPEKEVSVGGFESAGPWETIRGIIHSAPAVGVDPGLCRS